MHRSLPWVGVVSAESVSGGSMTSSYTRISSSYSSTISSNSGSPVITISPNSFSMGVFGSRTRVDGIWPSMDFGIWISILSVWLDGWGEPFFCLDWMDEIA